jgi:hypothetical protein
MSYFHEWVSLKRKFNVLVVNGAKNPKLAR